MQKPAHFINQILLVSLLISGQVALAQRLKQAQVIHPLNLANVAIDDPFWSPKYRVWDAVTVFDVLDKLEGKYDPDRPDIKEEKAKTGRTRNAFLNFDLVAQGKKNIDAHDGPPWYDGLVYETITGASDMLQQHPDLKLEKKLDGYINRIAAAQAADPDGYLNTYTTLTRPDKRWGINGGDDKWQHDIYNSGMLVEAGVHYYKATGKTKLLNVAVKLSNYIYTQIGPAPKLNVIPGHAGPEWAMLTMYQLFKDHPELKRKINVPVNEGHYLELARFWIEDRGNYGEADGSHARKSDSSYNQDQMPVLQQTTIEGHAVRATLLATGVTQMALMNNDARYIKTADRYWNNMIGKRMFITGGEGAIADGERFGRDYFLPESAYLETCAAIGAGFFSEKMNELHADGKYMDELERVIYNNLLSGISLDGNHYFYENPLAAINHPRWAWHSCPCCPPMILKMVSALPQYIYGYNSKAVYVNLFISSSANIKLDAKTNVRIHQETQYPWKGGVKISVNPALPASFTLNVRIPGWAQGRENPFGLYQSDISGQVTLTVNGKAIPVNPVNGYAAISRTWKKGDVVLLNLPMQPRAITPNEAVKTVQGKIAFESGPVVYALEGLDNADVNSYSVKPGDALNLTYRPRLLNGVNVITGNATDSTRKPIKFTAVPFYSIGNRGQVSPYRVWLKKE